MSSQIGPSGPSYRQRLVANRWLGVALGALTFVILLGTASGYGLTYDEPVYASRSQRAGQWLALVFTAPSEAFRRDTIDRLWDPTGDEQAGLMKLIAWPVASAVSTVVGPLAAIRAGTMLVVSLLMGCLFVFVANAWGRLEALFASLGLLAMPRVFADCHLMALDAPVMAWSGLALMAAYLAARAYVPPPSAQGKTGNGLSREALWWLIVLGLAFGAAIATKVNGWFLPFIVLPWLFAVRRRLVLPALVSMAIGGPLVFVLSWPWLWHDTLPRLMRYLSFFGQHYPVGVTYFGHTYNHAPWHFPLVMLLITTPVVVLLLAGVGLGRLFCGARARPAPALASPEALLGLMAWAVFVNLLPGSLPSSPKYNGVRLFLPVFVPLIVLGAAGFGRIARSVTARVAHSAREARLVLGLLLVLALAPGLYATAHSYPFGLSYYNLLIGGPRGAAARGMEATYWGDTFLAAVPWLNQKAPPGAQVWINIPGFVSSVQMYQHFGMMREDLRISGGDEAFPLADFCVVVNKSTELGAHGQELARTGKVLYTQELDGVPLVWVFAGNGGNRGPATGHR